MEHDSLLGRIALRYVFLVLMLMGLLLLTLVYSDGAFDLADGIVTLVMVGLIPIIIVALRRMR